MNHEALRRGCDLVFQWSFSTGDATGAPAEVSLMESGHVGRHNQHQIVDVITGELLGERTLDLTKDYQPHTPT